MATTSAPVHPERGMFHPWVTNVAVESLPNFGWGEKLRNQGPNRGPSELGRNGLRARLHLAFLLCGAFSVLAVYSAILVHVQGAKAPKPISWPGAIRSEFTYCYLALALSPLVVTIKRRYPLGRKKWMRNLSVHLLAMLAFSFVTKGVWDFVAGPETNYAHTTFTFEKMFRSVFGYSDFGCLLYWLIVLIALSVDLYGRYELEAVHAAHLQTQLAQAQVQSLKMQLHPHFLFNTLNSISALVRDHPETAETMIARLSDLLRRALDSASTQEITLRQELEFLQLYLEIEQARFEERLKVHFTIDPAALEALVPNMILQPLVENAIRHGIANKVENGEVTISAKKRGGDLLLKVADNGVGLSPSGVLSIKQGVGLASTKGRLERLYGVGQALHLEAPDTGGFVARIVVPFMTVSAGRKNGQDQNPDR